MNASTKGIVLWLTGWSLPDKVFDRLRKLLPEYTHLSIEYNASDTPESMLAFAESAVKRILIADEADCSIRRPRGPVLISGWSLGSLLALRLAAHGYADGLVLFGATAKFTRPQTESALGFADVHVRQMIRGISRDRATVELNFRRLLFTAAEREAGFAAFLPPIGSWTTPALISGLQILRSEECFSRLSGIACPVLLFHGTADQICSYQAVLELKDQLPQAKLVTIPASGHVPFLGREASIAEEWRRWRHGRQEGDPTTI
ncbi:alpha/beta hydrolase [Paenibacillus harenae]|uniref:Pimeloyl-[acyl-carrier protein] methyl ester esterase n=1 Tax=Paenibacillus harenae TaxID=306543 RepID=A0ABT9U4M8_PAEHA|nr:alpha/beta hydrolase [Paenibacillus harenae]MDQ0114207.1 pimeloyl-[acyl-carrier protein] methyl ester esterase [Paenibacillus harenae]